MEGGSKMLDESHHPAHLRAAIGATFTWEVAYAGRGIRGIVLSTDHIMILKVPRYRAGRGTNRSWVGYLWLTLTRGCRPSYLGSYGDRLVTLLITNRLSYFSSDERFTVKSKLLSCCIRKLVTLSYEVNICGWGFISAGQGMCSLTDPQSFGWNESLNGSAGRRSEASWGKQAVAQPAPVVILFLEGDTRTWQKLDTVVDSLNA